MNSWSARWSRAYCRAAWPHAQHEKIMTSLEAFVLWKEAFLRRLKAKGISIPKKSRKGQTLLEHLAGVLEGELKEELIRLI